MYKIEKNIPMPEGRGRKKKYPFEEMESGDSFFVKCGKKEVAAVRAAVLKENRACMTHKWSTRTVDGGLRVWCLEK
jgi:hypothetical protein